MRTSSKVLSWPDIDPSLISLTVRSKDEAAAKSGLKNPAPAPAPAPAAGTTASTTVATVSSTTTVPSPVSYQETVCEVGLDQQDCKANERCAPVQDKSRNGVCRCEEGFSRNPAKSNACEPGKLVCFD